MPDKIKRLPKSVTPNHLVTTFFWTTVVITTVVIAFHSTPGRSLTNWKQRVELLETTHKISYFYF